MTTRKQQPLPEINAEGVKRADEVLRRMLNTPPTPFTPKAKKRAKKK